MRKERNAPMKDRPVRSAYGMIQPCPPRGGCRLFAFAGVHLRRGVGLSFFAFVFFASAVAAFAGEPDPAGDGISFHGWAAKGAISAICGVVGAYISARWGKKARLEPDPLHVEAHKKEEYVRKEEFERHVSENAKEHESLYARMNRNDRETSEIRGKLDTIIDDLRLIKNKLLKTGGK